jgi:hypothetical protein
MLPLLHLLQLMQLLICICRGVSSAAAGEELVRAEQKTLLLTVARTSIGSRRNVQANVEALKGIADVGVLIFHSDPRRTWEMWNSVRKKAEAADVVLRLRAPPPAPPRPPTNTTTASKRLNNSFVPKLYFQVQAQDWIALYEVLCIVVSLHLRYVVTHNLA